MRCQRSVQHRHAGWQRSDPLHASHGNRFVFYLPRSPLHKLRAASAQAKAHMRHKTAGGSYQRKPRKCAAEMREVPCVHMHKRGKQCPQDPPPRHPVLRRHKHWPRPPVHTALGPRSIESSSQLRAGVPLMARQASHVCSRCNCGASFKRRLCQRPTRRHLLRPIVRAACRGCLQRSSRPWKRGQRRLKAHGGNTCKRVMSCNAQCES